ncbi:cysteine hydrolase family protein, partial [Roseococcus thiosulfatophilus]|uniref:cysteine hydrolase family protein n=1 Tax=Roseococcus thiosulfatophilus TaxID=35813 RepID=UPI001F5C2A15
MTARQLYAALKSAPPRARFGFGRRAALVNVDPQRAYTDVAAFPATAYETDPLQCAHINTLAALCREKRFPVVWTYVAYVESGEDCGVWGTRTDTPDSLQNIKEGSARAQFDPRLHIAGSDIVIKKRMASAFFET